MVFVACRTLSTAQRLIIGLPENRAKAISLDVSNTSALESICFLRELAHHEGVGSKVFQKALELDRQDRMNR